MEKYQKKYFYRDQKKYKPRVAIRLNVRAITIREATVVDVLAIIQARLASTSENETKGFTTAEWATFSSPEELKKVWDEENKLKDGSEVIVVEKEGEIIGFIVFKKERDHIYIDNLHIIKKEQRKGIGKSLVTRIEQVARDNGYSCLKTDTTENVEGVPWKSYGFWTKMGYKDTGERLLTEWDFKMIPFVKNL